MIIAVIAVGVVQVTVDQVVDVVAVGNRFVSTIRAVNVVRIVTPTIVTGGTIVGVGRGHFQRVLFDLAVTTNMVQMSIVQVIDVVSMLDARVLAIGTVLVIVVFM